MNCDTLNLIQILFNFSFYKVIAGFKLTYLLTTKNLQGGSLKTCRQDFQGGNTLFGKFQKHVDFVRVYHILTQKV